MHPFRVPQRIDGAEVRAEGVSNQRHLFQPGALAPLFERFDEERLGFVHAPGNVVALRTDAEWHARGAAHPEPIECVHGCAPRASPSSQSGEVAEEKAQSRTVAVQQYGGWRCIGRGSRGLDGEGVEVVLGFREGDSFAVRNHGPICRAG